jgi:hypothetical protein
MTCAEELLRSGGFGLIVVTGLGRHAGRCGVRLSRAAKAGGSGLVMVGAAPDVAALRVVCRVEPDAWRWAPDPFGAAGEPMAVRIRLEARSLGWSGATSFELPVWIHGIRTALDPLLVDRRGIGGRRGAWRRGAGKERESGHTEGDGGRPRKSVNEVSQKRIASPLAR